MSLSCLPGSTSLFWRSGQLVQKVTPSLPSATDRPIRSTFEIYGGPKPSDAEFLKLLESAAAGMILDVKISAEDGTYVSAARSDLIRHSEYFKVRIISRNSSESVFGDAKGFTYALEERSRGPSEG
jgi:hypothetical protein